MSAGWRIDPARYVSEFNYHFFFEPASLDDLPDTAGRPENPVFQCEQLLYDIYISTAKPEYIKPKC